MNIFLKIEEALKNKLPFVAYKKPNTLAVKGYFQKNSTLFTSDNYNESGFIFAPFNNKNSAVILPEEASCFFEEEVTVSNIELSKNASSQNTISKTNHIALVKKGIKAIENNQFKKVVLSRKEENQLTSFNALNTFKKLLNKYPSAFTYIWFHPKVGMWLGATPETLVKIKGKEFSTMSLAGTQTYTNTQNVSWQEKEIEEQQFVTDYITDKLSVICNAINISDTETIKAGNLLHLRTIITGTLNTNNASLIKTLHPTPAVCGLPLEASKDFILKNENYNRSFYTGFLGELNLDKSNKATSELFVNLRCMQISNNNAIIYVGGGITKESNAENEWKETVAKTTTMKAIL